MAKSASGLPLLPSPCDGAELSFTAEHPKDQLVADIAAIRGSRLAEHAGTTVMEAAANPGELVARTDLLCRPGTKLRRREIKRPASDGERVVRLERIFDPSKPLTELELGEVFGWPRMR